MSLLLLFRGGVEAPTVKFFLLSPTVERGWMSADGYSPLTRHGQGRTVVKRDGQWLTVHNKKQEWLDGCEFVFRGGYENQVTPEQRTELQAAGFAVETRGA